MENTKKSQLGTLLQLKVKISYLQNNQKKEFWLVSEAEQPEAAQSDAVPVSTPPPDAATHLELRR